jgi:hypothetical protein
MRCAQVKPSEERPLWHSTVKLPRASRFVVSENAFYEDCTGMDSEWTIRGDRWLPLKTLSFIRSTPTGSAGQGRLQIARQVSGGRPTLVPYQ